MKRKKSRQARNRKGLVGWPIIFMMAVSVVAVTVVSIHTTKIRQDHIITTSATRNTADLLATALTSFPECFAYVEDGIVLRGVISETKLDDGNSRKDCVELGPVMWSIDIVKYDEINGEMTSLYENIGQDIVPIIGVWKDTIIKKADGSTYTAKMIIYLGHKNAKIEVYDTDYLDYETTFWLFEGSTFGPPITTDNMPEGVTSGSDWMLEARIVNLTDMSEGCGELSTENIVDNTCLVFEWRLEKDEGYSYSPGEYTMVDEEGNYIPLAHFCRFTIRDRADTAKRYEGPVEGCRMRITAYTKNAISRNAYEKVIVRELP